ncbi:hypothetical protein [Arthrobacter sp. H5]|uniref:hypothetical protein n=1 Tax=Arthrobacter sp. H5 TaxID=1267973 RepID=UPI001C1E57AF|nr:hypothetical protein [Arthrobacter sp. H5]
MKNRHAPTTKEKSATGTHKIRNQPKTTTQHHKRHHMAKFNQSKNNRYQQTWHTIEFSNNRHTRHQTTPKQALPSLRSNFSNLPAKPNPVKSAATQALKSAFESEMNRSSMSGNPTRMLDQRGYKL